jgi:hypothetical protein
MKFAFFNEIILALGAFPISIVYGHGYIFEPPSRNYYAHTDGLNSGSIAAVPNKEYCPHCLNSNAGVCGISEGGTDFDAWLDSQGNPMPFISQRTYNKGEIIEIKSHLTAVSYEHVGQCKFRLVDTSPAMSSLSLLYHM